MKTARHLGIFGATGSGKTFYALHEMDKAHGRVLYFNPQEEEVNGVVRADWKDPLEDVIAATQVNYVPQPGEESREELALIVDAMMGSPWSHTLICDEAHDFAPQGGTPGPLELIARRGRAKDVTLWALSVHPADISKTVLRQLQRVVLFSLPYSSQYLQTYRIPAERLEAIHREGGRYSYAVWDGLDLTGPHRV